MTPNFILIGGREYNRHLELYPIPLLYDTIRYDTMHYIYVRPKADKASLNCRTEPNKK